jgi:uncharacterized protein YqcC (DUF446 family)
MLYSPNSLKDQIALIEDAMRIAGVWSEEIPDWIRSYREGPIPDIWEWLQFIHLPMRLNGTIKKAEYLAPRLSPFTNGNADHQNILQLVIELDSITSTLA